MEAAKNLSSLAFQLCNESKETDEIQFAINVHRVKNHSEIYSHCGNFQ